MSMTAILMTLSAKSSGVATYPDLDLVFGAVDVNVDVACTSLLSPLSHLPPPTSSPPSSAAAGKPIRDPGVFTIIIIFFPYWWLSYNKLFYLSEHPFHFCMLTLSHARNVLEKNSCSISTGITCSLARSTLGPSPAMITS